MIRYTLLFVIGLSLVPSSLLAQTESALERIKTLTRLYGYVRFFHPSDEAAQADWEQLAVYGAGQVRGVSDPDQLTPVLSSLFAPVAPTLMIHPAAENKEFTRDALIPDDSSGYRTVAWQHRGIQLEGRGSAYQSKRTARTSRAPSATFGTLTGGTDATRYRGQDIKLRASVRMAAGTPGTGHLWLRVDRGSERGFFQNMADRPITDTTWQSYEIVGTVAPDATAVAFGSFLKGEGSLWVDDFQLYTKNPRDTAWKKVDLANAGFESDEVGEAPGSWFAKSPGYAFQVTDSQASQGSKSVQIFTAGPNPDELLFDQYPEVGEVFRQEIGSGLACTMPLALYGTPESTYPAVDASTWASFLQQVEAGIPENATGDELDVRLGGIMILWNVFQHFYPYFDVVSVNWEQALDDALRSAYRDTSATDFLRTLRVFTARLQDGHVRVYLPGDNSETHYPPLGWEWVEDSLLITDSEQAEVHVGDIVTRINGQLPRDYFASVYETISAATPGWRDFRAKEASLAGPAGSELRLELRTEEGDSRQLLVKREVPAQSFYRRYLMRGGSDTTYQKLEEGVYYVNLDKASMDEIREHLDSLQQAKSIIFDLRGYPNSNSEVIAHLLNEPDTSSAWMQVPQIIYPDQQRVVGYQPYGWEIQPESPHLDARIIFITDGRAISYAESFMSFIEHYDLATIVGQPTAGTNGNVNSFSLPGRYRVYWTGMKVRKHDGSPLHGVGILPDVYVEKSIDGVRSGRDEFLEKALEIARAE